MRGRFDGPEIQAGCCGILAESSVKSALEMLRNLRQ